VTFFTDIYIEKIVGGTKTTITTFPFSFTTSSHIRLRVQHIGSALKVKAWLEGSSEPAGWDVSVTENSISAAGYFGLVSDLFGGSGTGVSEYWDYNVTDGASGPTVTSYNFVESLSAGDSMGGGGAFSGTEGLTTSDLFLGGNAYVPIEALNAGDVLLNSVSYQTTDQLVGTDALLNATAFTGTDALSANDSLFATVQAALAEALGATDQVLQTFTAQFVEALSIADMLNFSNVTPVASPLPTLLVVARFRSGVVQATFRDGEQVARFRDGVVVARGR
jgi:hypothetical protein